MGIVILSNGVPNSLLEKVARVEVRERLGETTQYSIVFEEDVCENDFQLLRTSALDPNAELSVLVPVGNGMDCLVKGPVSSQQIRLQHGGAGSQLEVRGNDSTIKMDREFKSEVWPNVTDGEAVTRILLQNAYLTDVATTNGRHLETEHSLVQRSTDLQFIKRLARRNGFHFWITCDPLGITETAHFKRIPLEGSPEIELKINTADSNLDSFDLSWDTERPTSVEGSQHNTRNQSTLSGDVQRSPQTTLGRLSLQDITGDVRSTSVAAPANDAGDMQARGEATLMESDWFIRANCRTSAQRLCSKVVRAHTLVKLVGAGSRHSGTYLVSSVSHSIDAAGHSMDVELLRNGWDD